MASRLEVLETRYNAYIDAEIKILGGAQSYKIGSREMTRANLSHIKNMIDDLWNAIQVEKARVAGRGRNKGMRIIPRDL